MVTFGRKKAKRGYLAGISNVLLLVVASVLLLALIVSWMSDLSAFTNNTLYAAGDPLSIASDVEQDECKLYSSKHAESVGNRYRSFVIGYPRLVKNNKMEKQMVKLPFMEEKPFRVLKDKFWSRIIGGWEETTWRVFDQEITSDTNYIGFGEWIGPVGLFASRRAKRAILMDADPFAFTHLEANIKENLDEFKCKVTLDPRCVSSEAGTVNMKGWGSSGSTLSQVGRPENRKWEKGTPSWDAECDTLPAILKEYGISTAKDHIFVKIDTEGAESLIVPSLQTWIQSAVIKPTIFIR